MTDVEGCLVTHEHKDHCVALNNVLRSEIDCYMSEGTAKALGVKHHRLNTIQARKQFKLGTWTILPFEVEHDVSEPLGFLIQSEAGEKLLFATDTYYIRYRFKGLNIIAVECNYSKEILEENILNGRAPIVLRKRLEKSHFSLNNYLEFLKANDLTDVKEIWLLHMSSNNSDEKLFKSEVQKVAGKPVYIA